MSSCENCGERSYRLGCVNCNEAAYIEEQRYWDTLADAERAASNRELSMEEALEADQLKLEALASIEVKHPKRAAKDKKGRK